jgi:hypothetical protein
LKVEVAVPPAPRRFSGCLSPKKPPMKNIAKKKKLKRFVAALRDG